MKITNVQACLTSLSRKRTFFVSEADFQHCFARELESFGYTVFLEYPLVFPGTNKMAYIDIMVWDADNQTCHPIELKYKTKKDTCKGIPFHHAFQLKSHSASDINRYLFWKDVFRLERIKQNNSFGQGFAIFLTNDDNYWTPSVSKSPIDALFRLDTSNLVQSVSWQNTKDAPDYKAGNVLYSAFSLRRPYIIPKWKLYSTRYSTKNASNCFKSLTIEV